MDNTSTSSILGNEKAGLNGGGLDAQGLGELLRGKVGQNSRHFWRFVNSFCEQTSNAREDIFTSTDAFIPPDFKYVRNFYVVFLKTSFLYESVQSTTA